MYTQLNEAVGQSRKNPTLTLLNQIKSNVVLLVYNLCADSIKITKSDNPCDVNTNYFKMLADIFLLLAERNVIVMR